MIVENVEVPTEVWAGLCGVGVEMNEGSGEGEDLWPWDFVNVVHIH